MDQSRESLLTIFQTLNEPDLDEQIFITSVEDFLKSQESSEDLQLLIIDMVNMKMSEEPENETFKSVISNLVKSLFSKDILTYSCLLNNLEEAFL